MSCSRTARIFSALLSICVGCSLATLPLLAQAVSARLEGRVIDPTQAVIPGVTVAATNEATNIAIEAITNESGRYTFPNLTPGTYTLSASLTGFKTSVTKGILLQIGDAKTQDLQLQMGDISETVTVTAEGSLVNTATTKVGAVVQDRQALDLPLNGRDAMMLFYLQAGTNPIDRYGNQQQTGVVDGLAPHTSSIKVEGILSSNPGFDYTPSHPSTPVPQEAVGEYRVTTSGELADGGRASGAQVKVLIKSGSNTFHGSVFEFNRNTVYNANDFFSNRANKDRPVLRRNQFGFAFGGPVRKNRTFFFGTAEWQRQNEDVVQTRTVYTETLWDSGESRQSAPRRHNTSYQKPEGTHFAKAKLQKAACFDYRAASLAWISTENYSPKYDRHFSSMLSLKKALRKDLPIREMVLL